MILLQVVPTQVQLSCVASAISSTSFIAKDYARDGVLQTTIKCYAVDNRPLLTVGIICEIWSGWVVLFWRKKFDIQWIIVIDSTWVQFVKRLFPMLKVMHAKSGKPQLCGTIHVVAINTNNPKLWKDPLAFGVVLLFNCSLQCKHRFWEEWVISVWHISHFEVGGTSSALSICTKSSRSNLTTLMFKFHNIQQQIWNQYLIVLLQVHLQH